MYVLILSLFSESRMKEQGRDIISDVELYQHESNHQKYRINM